MLAQPRGGNSSSAAADHSLLSFAAQHPLRYVWELGAELVRIPTGLTFEQRDALNQQVRQVVVSDCVEDLV